MRTNKKDILNRIKEKEKSDIDVSHWEKIDFDAQVTCYMVENNCTYNEAVEAVQASYGFNPDDYQGINDLSDFIDDEMVSDIIEGVYDEKE